MRTLVVWLSTLSTALLVGCATHQTAMTDQDPSPSTAEETASVSNPSSYFRPAAISRIDVSTWQISSADDADLNRIDLQLLNLSEQIKRIEDEIEEFQGYLSDPNVMTELLTLNRRRIALEAQREARLSLLGIERTPTSSVAAAEILDDEEWWQPEDPNDPAYLACEADRMTLGSFGSNFICAEGILFPYFWISEMAPAAGPGGDYCQVRLTDTSELVITCEQSYDRDLPLTQARVERDGDLGQQLLEIALTLAGPHWELGAPSATTCHLNIDFELNDERAERLLPPCRDWMAVLEDRFEMITESNLAELRGRIGHHAPGEMVVSQPYFLQLAILPISDASDAGVADVQIASAMDSGLMDPDATTRLNIEFTTASISDQMSVSLVGSGFDIVPISPDRQSIHPNVPTIWEFEVTPHSEGRRALTYSVSQSTSSEGERVNREVERLRVPVLVSTIDSLLAEPEPVSPTFVAAPPSQLDASLVERAASGSSQLCTTISGAGADANRQALLMTNASYQPPITTLSLTHTDGERLSSALTSLGFNVRHCRDLDRTTALRELRALGRALKSRTDSGEQTLAFFYYSGHGANVDQTNFIIPVDTEGATPGAIADGGVRFEDVFNRLTESVSVASVIVFDACRTVMSEDSRGLIPTYQPVGWVSGALQAFATSPGQTAADDGLYSEVLANVITSIDEPAGTIFKRVQDAVFEQTAGRQKPVYADATVGGDVFFRRTTN